MPVATIGKDTDIGFDEDIGLAENKDTMPHLWGYRLLAGSKVKVLSGVWRGIYSLWKWSAIASLATL